MRRRSTVRCSQVKPAAITPSPATAIPRKNHRVCHHAGSTANRSSVTGPQLPAPIRARDLEAVGIR